MPSFDSDAALRVVADARASPAGLGEFPCWELARRIYDVAGVALPDADAIHQMKQVFERAELPYRTGDLIVWKIDGEQHVAVVVDALAVHAGRTVGVMVHPMTRVVAFPDARVFRYAG